MRYAAVNAEYERELFREVRGPYSEQAKRKARASLEFLFFFLNKDSDVGLVTQEEYSQEYQRHLENLGVTFPVTNSSEPGINWYGKMTDLPLERNLNSKLWSYNFLKEQGREIENLQTVRSKEEIKKILESNSSAPRWLLKSPFRASGGCFHTIEKDTAIPEIGHPFILEPLLERKVDLVCHYEPETNESIFYVSRISKKFSYLGALIFQKDKDMEEYLFRCGYLEPFLELRSFWEKAIKSLRHYKLQQPLTLDSFVYQKEGKNRAYPLCEINYRVNMGTLLGGLRRFLPPGGAGELINVTKIPNRNFIKELRYDPDTRNGIVVLNEKSDTAFLFLAGNSLQTLRKLRWMLSRMYGNISL